MGNQRGFTLMELVVVVGMIGVLAAVALPGLRAALERNRVITSSDLVAATIREARLAAITRNSPFRVRFNCPVDGALRMIAVVGTPAIDNSADRCTMNQPNDGPILYMPENVSFGVGDADPPILEINGRGEIAALGAGMPQTISVSHGENTRTIVVTAAGRVRTPNE